MPYPNEHAARVLDPNNFIANSFRSKELGQDTGIRIIVGKLNGEDTMTTQAYRFSGDKFTVEQAKKWLEDHKIKFINFEPANGGESMDDNLKHAGIKGMKWGIRSKRDMPGETGGKKPKSMSGDAKEVLALKAKKAHELSNEELQKVSKRMELEKKFKDLNPSKLTKGKKKIEGIFSAVGKTAGVIGSVTTLAVVGKKVIEYAVAHPKVIAKAAKTADNWVI